MHSFFKAFSLFLFIIFHSVANDISSNIDTQIDTQVDTSFSIFDVQQPPFTGDPLEQPGPGSSFNAGTSPEGLLADESDACLDPNQNNPHSKARVRRGSTPPDYCLSPLVPEAGPIKGPKKPEAGRNAGDGVRSGTRKFPKKTPQRFEPSKMPTFQDGETIENPCTRYTIAKTPVCDSGYFGPTVNLAECRLWTPFSGCVPNTENLWCCVIVKLGRPPLAMALLWNPAQQQLAGWLDPAYPYYGIQCRLQPMRSAPRS